MPKKMVLIFKSYNIISKVVESGVSAALHWCRKEEGEKIPEWPGIYRGESPSHLKDGDVDEAIRRWTDEICNRVMQELDEVIKFDY